MNTINVSWTEWFSAHESCNGMHLDNQIVFYRHICSKCGFEGCLNKTPFSVECLQTMIFILLKEVTSPKKVLSNQVANWI